MALLEIENLTVEFATAHGAFRAVDGVSFEVDQRDVLAIVGESGSGKSVAMLAVMGLLPWTATVTADRLAFAGRELLKLDAGERRKIIGKDISWTYHGDSFHGATDSSRPLVICQDLAKRAGRLSSFTADGQPLSAADLDKCNAKAGAPTALANAN